MRRILLGSLCGVWLMTSGCGDEGTNGNGDAKTVDCSGSPANLTTSALYNDVVSVRCASCHKPGSSGSTSGKLELDNLAKFSAVVGRTSLYDEGDGSLKIVTPNSPQASTLLLKVLGGSPEYTGPDGESVGAKMPPAGLLPEEEREMFRQWICNGADDT